MVTSVIGAGSPTGPRDIASGGAIAAHEERSHCQRSSAVEPLQGQTCGVRTIELEGVRQHAGQQVRYPRLVPIDGNRDERLNDDGFR